MDQDSLQKLADLTERSGKQRRRFFAKQPKKISSILSQLITAKAYAATSSNTELEETWATAVGPLLAKQSQAFRLYRSKLEVTVSSSTMMQELKFEEHRLLKKIQAALPNNKITGLKFKVGSIN